MNKSYKQKVDLINKWSDFFYNKTESWDTIGTTLAHLFASIAKDEVIDVAHDSELVSLLKNNKVSDKDEIWSYLNVYHPDQDVVDESF